MSVTNAEIVFLSVACIANALSLVVHLWTHWKLGR
jgi:hypothetical protein